MASVDQEIQALFAKSGERRRAPRRPLPHAHVLALWKPDSELPLLVSQRVEGKDISRTGAAFFWHRSPEFHSVLLRFGEEHPVFVIARVVWSSEGYWRAKRKYIVGCEFTGRLELDEVRQLYSDNDRNYDQAL